MRRKLRKLLITGGCGFIGSNFIRYILERYPEYKIINLDKLAYCGNLENLKSIENNPRYTFVKGDICDQNLLRDILKGISCVVNFAAQTHVDRSIVSAAEFIETNVKGTYALLEVSRKLKVEKFIQISTDEVYGSIKKGSFTEESALRPNSPYAASKASADTLCRAYFITYAFPVVIVRSTNNFGPYQFPEKIIPLFITNVLEGKKVPLYGKGKNIRDWLYVEDNCRAIDLVLHKGKAGEIYNVAGGHEVANLALTKLILQKLDKSENFIRYVKDRPGHDFRYSIDSSKLNKMGWRRLYGFGRALELTINWYLNNERWWRKLKKQ
jgi:dTDP-glucose 4,6-dehydratase